MNPGIYLFCLTPASPLPVLAGNGIDGEHPLFVEVVGEIAAVLAEVDLEEFSGEAAREKLEDLAWIAPRALRHEEVVMTVLDQGPVLPVRFGAVFSSLEATVAPLRERQDVLIKFFQDTAGKQEWTVKGYVDLPQARARLTATRLAEEQEQMAGLSQGKRYFVEQKIKGEVEKATMSWLKVMGEDLRTLTREMSAGFCDCRLQSREVTGRNEDLFFHVALLVLDESLAALEGVMDDWKRQHDSLGIRIELYGPWPPYHFAPEF